MAVEVRPSHPDPEAGHPRLGDLGLGFPDAESIADADVVITETVDGEVLVIGEGFAGELWSVEVSTDVQGRSGGSGSPSVWCWTSRSMEHVVTRSRSIRRMSRPPRRPAISS
jgi:hypothetical protein